MLDANQFSQHLLQCANGQLSVCALEEWFDSNSWDVHQSGNARLTDAVFEFEELYAAYAAGLLPKKSFLLALMRLASAILPYDSVASSDGLSKLNGHQIGTTTSTFKPPRRK